MRSLDPALPVDHLPGQDPEPAMVQLLNPEGERIDHPDYRFWAGASEVAAVRSLYRDMFLTRRIDTEATALQRHDELGLWAQLLGQEAAQIGSGRALAPADFAFPSYREHGVAYCRGLDPFRVLSLYRGCDQGAWDPTEHNFANYTVVIGAQTLHAVGYAMGVQRDGLVGTGDPERDTAVIVYFGDGATSQGDVSEAMIFAASYQAPVVFFCQNNQWAISAATQRQSRIPLSERSRGFGFPGVRVDGNDVLAVHAVTTAALQHVREGRGPFLIEAYTYRMGAHTTTDDPTRYRSAAELEEWRAKDPLLRVERYLSRTGGADPQWFADLAEEADELGQRLREGCRALADPDPLGIFDQVYVEQTPELAQQRADAAAYRSGFVDGLEHGAVR